VHGMQGLYVVDGSVMSRSSRVNPSLTIFAWALRVADRIAMSPADAMAARPATRELAAVMP
jgi:choline dehydrogenase-like flavoprotein